VNDNGTFEAAADACNLSAANTDGVSADDGVGTEDTANPDGDGLQNCEDPNNDNDAYADGAEDVNGNGTFEAAADACNLSAANTDGVSANDGVGTEDTANPDSDGLQNCEDDNNDGDGLTDAQEDNGFGGGTANDGLVNGGECNLSAANTDGVSANDGVGTEGTTDLDGDNFYNCADTNNDNDVYTDTQEDVNNNGTFEAAADACNLSAANTDGQSANDGVGNEGTTNTDGDGLQNCEDTDNDNDGVLDGAEDVNANGVFDGPVNGSNECNLIVVNTDNVNGPDGHAIEGMTDVDGDGRPNCNDTDNDGDGLNDTQDPTPNVPFSCNAAIKMRYLTPSVNFTAPNQLRTLRVRITRNLPGINVRLDLVDATATSPDITDVTKVSPALPRTITTSVTFTITVKGPATGPFPVTVNFPTTEFTPSFPGGVGDGEGADRLDYTFNCGTYIALSKPTPERLELHDLRSYTAQNQLVFEALGQGIKTISVQLYDIGGRTVLKAESHGNLLSVPLTGKHRLANGVYLVVLTVRGWDGTVVKSAVRKIVIKR
ncbi:MAG: T9SS type A sorting domain-containing protein, partial [Candidatus Bipolaricaulota bacterium]|nr:T9SS type A sorting domain-containing protein [Candidatus Bipolaricaulota bacterium]